MIRAKNGRIIPMRFRPSQEILWKQIAPRLDAGEKLWFIFLKARQAYISTFVQALTFVRTLEQTGTNSLVIAQDLDTSHDLFGKSKMFYDYLPLPKIGPSRIKELEFPFPGGVSRYRVISAGIAAKGRGTTQSCVHASEVAFWPHPEIMTGLMQAMPDLPDTIWIIESTANGLMGQGRLFYDEWNRAVRGESDLIPIFIPWFMIPEYKRAPGVPMDDWTPREKLMVETYGLTGEQLAWRRATILTKTQGSETLFDQEFPESPEVAFISKGNPAFDNLQLLAMRKEQRAPHVRWTLNSDTLEESEVGEVRVWHDPEPGKQYAIGADTAEGRTGGDYAAAEVIEMNSLTQVASIHGTIQPYDFAMLLNAVGRHYNNATLCIEVYPQGHAVQDVLIRHCLYPNLHRWRGKPDRAKMTPARLFGWETNVWSRPLLIEAGQRAINRGLVTLYEEGLIDELKHFTKTDDGRYEAEAGHDDRVIALLLALRSREENYIARGVPPQLSVPDAVGIRVVEGRDVKADAQRRVSRLLRDAKGAVKNWMSL